MNCRSVREQLWSDQGGWSPAAVEAHVRGCSACAAAAVEVKRMRSWLHQLPIEEPSAQFDWRLRLRLSQASKTGEPMPVDRSWWTPRAPLQFATSMAAAAVIVLAVGLLWTHSRGPESVPASGPHPAATPVAVRGPAPSVVQVRRGFGLDDPHDRTPLESSAARNDSDSTLVLPRR